MAVPVSYYFLYFEQISVLYMFYWLNYTKHMFINKVTMNIMINLIQMLLIFVFEIRPRDRLQNDSDAMTVFKIISLFPRDQWSELFNVGGFPTERHNKNLPSVNYLMTPVKIESIHSFTLTYLFIMLFGNLSFIHTINVCQFACGIPWTLQWIR
jgi:hypothetical protein